MDIVTSVLVLALLVPLAVWISLRRSRVLADDAEQLIRNVIGDHRGVEGKRGAPRNCPNVDEQLYGNLIRHFDQLNAAQKSLRIVAESARPIGADNIVAALNAMQKVDGKNDIPGPIVKIVLDGLVAGGFLVMDDGMYNVSREGSVLNNLIRG